jgi:chromosome segregation ATPase
MDDRKKTIRDLEDQRRTDREGVNKLLETLGESLFSRIESGNEPREVPGLADSPYLAWKEYSELLREIAENGEIIDSIEADTRKLKEAEEQISFKELEHSEKTKEISLLFVQLGQYILADPSFDGFSLPYKSQMDELLLRIDAQEAKLDELEEKTGNIFTWIGKNAQSLAIKTMLMKNQAGLHKIYRSAGEKFITTHEKYEDGEADVQELAEKAGDLHQATLALSDEIVTLKEERRRISDMIAAGGSPARRIQTIEKHISRAKDSAREACCRYGTFAIDPAWGGYFDPLLNEDDHAKGNKVELLREAIKEADVHIEKLKAAIAIDEEKAEIEKLKTGIEGQRRKIAAAEESIADMEKHISELRVHIEELQKIVDTQG